MQRATLGNLVIQSDVRDGSGSAQTLSVSGPAVHEIIVTNRTTLAYDVMVESEFPDKSGRALSYANPPADRWTKNWNGIAAMQKAADRANLDVHGPPQRHQRLHVVEVRYRIAIPGIGPGTVALWQVYSAPPLPLAIQVDVA